MNKNDIKLIIIILIIVVICFIFYFMNNKQANKALVYYESDVILEIDLSKNDTYEVMGENGKVIIEVNNNQIRVKEENSPYHLCQKQGYISNTNETLICLPNKIIIELPGEDNIDTEVK